MSYRNDPPLETVFGRNLRARRKFLQLRQQDLSQLLTAHGLEVSQSTVASWEGAVRPVTLHQLGEVARILGVPPSVLIAPPIDPVRLCCGRRQSEHDTTGICPTGTVMCAYCFNVVTPDELAIDADGNRVDVCCTCYAEDDPGDDDLNPLN